MQYFRYLKFLKLFYNQWLQIINSLKLLFVKIENFFVNLNFFWFLENLNLYLFILLTFNQLLNLKLFLCKIFRSERERNAWVNSINLNAALLSSEPLSAAVGSKQLKFQKPLLPSSPGTLNIVCFTH